MLEDSLTELMEEPLNEEGAVGGVKLVGVSGMLDQSKVQLNVVRV